MLRLLIAIVLLWALLTSGITIGEVLGSLVEWTASHIELEGARL